MNPKQIDRFFQVLSRELREEAKIFITGAAAGALWGHIRPSADIDFAIELKSRDPRQWDHLEEALERTVRLTGIQANYAEDIDRWGQISILDYKRRAIAYRRFGPLRVYLLDPVAWSIGKMTRYMDADVKDMVEVFRRQRTPANRLIKYWAEALRHSPLSARLLAFRKQVEHFLKSHGRTIWGKVFDPQAAIRQFHRRLGLKE
jgi:hypothetical protein